jgi:hypothetical protein
MYVQKYENLKNWLNLKIINYLICLENNDLRKKIRLNTSLNWFDILSADSTRSSRKSQTVFCFFISTDLGSSLFNSEIARDHARHPDHIFTAPPNYGWLWAPFQK